MKFHKYKYFLAPALFLLFSFAGLRSQTVTFTKTNVTCNGSADGTITATLSGGSSSYRYVYYKTFDPSESDSFGPTSSLSHTFTNLDPDYYTIFVRDLGSGNVLDFNTLEITQPAVLNATLSSTNLSCFGGGTGTITISSPSGGSGTYDYTISGGASWQTSGSYTGLAAGTYNVQMRDRSAPGCIKILNAALVITQPAQLNATVNSTNVTCFGKGNGTIVISAPSGGSGTYEYSRNGGTSWQSGGTFSALAPGTYNVVMRDAANPSCTRTLNAALVITQPNQLTVTDISIIRGLTCNEGSDGQLRALVTGGTAPYTYDWYVNPAGSWVTISQFTQTATNLPQGWYEVRVNDANNCGVPTPATAREFFIEGATDSIPPLFVIDSASVLNTCQGQTNGAITIYVHGGKTPYRYSITTGGASGYQSSNAFTNLAAASYQTWAVDKKGCKKQGPDKTVATTPNSPVSVSIAANPSGSICPGTSVLFTATPANGGTTPAYQWRLNGSNVGTGAPTYTNSSLATGDQVNVILTSSLRCTTGNPATSNTITASLLTTTAITSQPVSLTQCPGTNATFTVTANGSSLTYQWYFNGSSISGATGASYTVNNISPANAGSYYVRVIGACGTVQSNTVTLALYTATAITTQPVSLTQCAGTNATFSVTATGSNLTYQWYFNGSSISGATGASYTINNISAANAGNYYVTVTGTCGTVQSNTVTLALYPATTITSQPVNLTQCAGTNATFSVTATGNNLTYQWYFNGSSVSGATGASYTINNISVANAGSYYVRVTGTCGVVQSNTVTLALYAATAITTQPVSLTQCEGTNATFSVTATGNNLTYQWYFNGSSISGATGASYTINNISAANAGSYYVIVTGTCGSVQSGTVTLTLYPPTAITSQPVNLTQCAGTNATFSVTATGNNLTYQWYFNGSSISGATGASYTINNISAANAGNYYVRVTGTCGIIQSNTVALALYPATAISTQPVSLTQCAGTNATFSVTATGNNLTYQWYFNGSSISGATGASYTINNISAANAGNYYVTVTGTCGSVQSNTVTLALHPPTAISTQPVSLTQCAGTNATFSVTATGNNLAYQWYFNGSSISGATGASYTINNISVANAGNYYVVVTGTCGNVTSNTVTLTIASNPAISDHPDDDEVCEGSDVSFSVTASGTNISYQWRRNGSILTGQTTSVLNLTTVVPAQSGNYDVLVYGMCDTITSNTAVLTVNPATAILSSDDDTLVCEGSTVDFNIVATGSGSVDYQWQWYYAGSWIDLSDDGDISGATTPDLEIQNVEAADSGFYRCFVSSACGTAYSDSVELNVNHIVATIGTPAPFLINSSSTIITVSVEVTDRFLNWDLGFALVAPDGTEVLLKGPLSFPCIYNFYNNGVDATFTTELDPDDGDTISWCWNSKPITGTYAATGDWSVLHGMDPANGAWQVRVYDSDRSVADPDGYLKSATLTFTDLDYKGDTATVSYQSGTINEEILNPISGELRATSYIVPIQLMTSCFNTEDASAVVTVRGGIPPYSYEWSGPTAEPDEARVDLGPGSYTVTVTDAFGCSTTATVEVSAPPAIVMNDMQYTDTIACFGAAVGIIRSKASGGTGMLDYMLMPGSVPSSVADSGVFVNLTAGSHTVRVTDVNGCALDTSVTISQRPLLVVDIDVVPVIGSNPGSITLTASGGTPPYQYSIDNGSHVFPTGDFDDLPEGVYPVYVEDANGCTFTEDVNLTVNFLDVDVNKNDVSCFGLADGNFYLTTNDGTGPYTLTASWLPSPETNTTGLFAYTGLSGGLYDVYIEDSEGWLYIDTVEIVEPGEITATALTTNANCSAYTFDGAVDLTVSGGTGTSYIFDWSNGETTEDLTGIEAGNYTVNITDEASCEASFEFLVNADHHVSADGSVADTSLVCPGVPNSITGVVYDSVSWEPAEIFEEPNNNTTQFTINDTTVISYYVYDEATGCYDIDQGTVFPIPAQGMEIFDAATDEALDTVLYINEGTTFEMWASDGFLDYAWQPDTWISDTAEQYVTINPLADIYYIVKGLSTAGCYESDMVHVVLRRPLEIYSGFSPNGDGINDTWVITNAEQYGPLIHVKVFNRWGEPVFETKGYNNDWDGTRNGKQLPVGAYYYIVEIDGGKPYTGTVTILR
jgi:gliding motility-associated-like protein